MTPSDGHDTIIHSPLTQTHGAEGHTLRIEIYRGADRPRWILEVIDDIGTSSVWDETFETDAAALDAAFHAFEAEGGVHAFVTSAQREAREAEPELMRRMDAAGRAAPRPVEPLAALAARDPAGLPDLAAPLTPAERDELDRRLMDFDNIDGMTLDMVDGFLHALAIGPLTLPPVDWLPQIWGQAPGEPLPALDDIDEATHLMGLVLRHFNGIVDGLERRPPQISPLCQGTILLNGERPHEGLWARGFHLAVQLAPEAWQPLLDDPDGRQWYRPIHLLGGDPGTPEVDAVRDAFELRLELAEQIAPGLLPMHAFWLPVRQALAAGVPTRRPGPKVGRNDPCPCGSGKKYKKCCGA